MQRHLRRASPNQTLPAITEGGVFLCESREPEGPRTVYMPAALGFAQLVSRGCSVHIAVLRPRIVSPASLWSRTRLGKGVLTPPARKTMDSTLKALIVKKFKDAELGLDVGRHWTDETVVLRVSGSVDRHEDQWIAPTISIPLIPTIAFFWERLGVEKDAAMSVLREAIAEAMRAKTNESPTIKSKMDDVAEAVAAE